MPRYSPVAAGMRAERAACAAEQALLMYAFVYLVSLRRPRAALLFALWSAGVSPSA